MKLVPIRIAQQLIEPEREQHYHHARGYVVIMAPRARLIRALVALR